MIQLKWNPEVTTSCISVTNVEPIQYRQDSEKQVTHEKYNYSHPRKSFQKRRNSDTRNDYNHYHYTNNEPRANWTRKTTNDLQQYVIVDHGIVRAPTTNKWNPDKSLGQLPAKSTQLQNESNSSHSSKSTNPRFRQTNSSDDED